MKCGSYATILTMNILFAPRALLALCLGLALILPARLAVAAEPFSFGVLNQQPAAETAALWNPILQYLNVKTGLIFRFRMGTTVQDTDAMTARGEFDFLYSNHHFDPEYAQANYRALAQWGGHPLIGQIVVPADSPITSLKELEGKTVAFPSKDAFIAYKVTRSALEQAGIKIQPVFGASQQGAAVQLQTGRADAASLSKLFADRFQSDGKIKFRVLFESDAWPNIPVLAHPRISKVNAELVRQVLIKMSEDPEGKALLAKLKIPGFLAVTDSDYAQTRLLYKEDF